MQRAPAQSTFEAGATCDAPADYRYVVRARKYLSSGNDLRNGFPSRAPAGHLQRKRPLTAIDANPLPPQKTVRPPATRAACASHLSRHSFFFLLQLPNFDASGAIELALSPHQNRPNCFTQATWPHCLVIKVRY